MNKAKPRNDAPGRKGSDLIALVARVRALARCLRGDPADADRLAKAALARLRGDPGPRADPEALAYGLVLEINRAGARGPAIVGGPGLFGKRGRADIGDLGRALLKLPLPQREALALVDAAGRSYHDAAAICGCAPGTIASRISRGRARLSAIMAEPKPSAERRIPDRTMAVLLAAVRARSGATARALGSTLQIDNPPTENRR